MWFYVIFVSKINGIVEKRFVTYLMSLSLVALFATCICINTTYVVPKTHLQTISLQNDDNGFITTKTIPPVNDESDTIAAYNAPGTDSSSCDHLKVLAKMVKSIVCHADNLRSELIINGNHFHSIIDIGQPLSILRRLNI